MQQHLLSSAKKSLKLHVPFQYSVIKDPYFGFASKGKYLSFPCRESDIPDLSNFIAYVNMFSRPNKIGIGNSPIEALRELIALKGISKPTFKTLEVRFAADYLKFCGKCGLRDVQLCDCEINDTANYLFELYRVKLYTYSHYHLHTKCNCGLFTLKLKDVDLLLSV